VRYFLKNKTKKPPFGNVRHGANQGLRKSLRRPLIRPMTPVTRQIDFLKGQKMDIKSLAREIYPKKQEMDNHAGFSPTRIMSGMFFSLEISSPASKVASGVLPQHILP
jgi:hypothetical protein